MTTMKTLKNYVNVVVDDATFDKLNAICRDDDRNRSALVRHFIKMGLEKMRVPIDLGTTVENTSDDIAEAMNE